MDGGRVAAMLTADTHQQIRTLFPAPLHRQLHELAHPFLVQHVEGIVLEDAPLVVQGQKLVLRILPGKRESGLGEVIGAKGEKGRFFRQAVGTHAGPYHLYHGAELKAQPVPQLGLQLCTDPVHDAFHEQQLLGGADLGHLDLGMHLQSLAVAGHGGFQHGANLHLVDFRESDAQAHPPVSQHGVGFIQGTHLLEHGLFLENGFFHLVGIHGLFRQGSGFPQERQGARQHLHATHGFLQPVEILQVIPQLLFAGQKFMDGRIEKTDGHGMRRHDLEQFLEVLALHGQQFLQGLAAVLSGLGHDHLDDHGQALHGIEHAFRAAQAYALGAVFQGAVRIHRRIGIGHHRKPGGFVRPTQQDVQLGGEISLHRGHPAQVDLATGTVYGDEIALADDRIAHQGFAQQNIYLNALGARHAGLAHAPGHHGGMGGFSAPAGEYAPGGEKAVDVLGLGLLAQQNHIPALAAFRLGPVGIEDHVTAGRAGGGR